MRLTGGSLSLALLLAVLAHAAGGERVFYADPEKGTGILMVCTFGDAMDVPFAA